MVVRERFLDTPYLLSDSDDDLFSFLGRELDEFTDPVSAALVFTQH